MNSLVTNKSKTKKLNKSQPMFCSPARHDMGVKDNTCLSVGELKAIASDYNKSIKNSSKKFKKVDIVDNKKKLVEELKEKLGPNDHAWVQEDFVNTSTKHQLKNAFRPLKPIEWYSNNQTWLNTFDILNVMKQYEEKYKDFMFLGVFPIDFADNDDYGHCVGQGMCNFGLKKVLLHGKKRFAMVLNTDRHDESGEHWNCCYCNLNPRRKNFGIYFYDSVANSPPREVAAFMQQMEKEAYQVFSKKVADRFVMRYNRIQRQFLGYDCGVFSEVFITQMLKDIPFMEICKRMPTDDGVNKLRDVLYTPQKL